MELAPSKKQGRTPRQNDKVGDGEHWALEDKERVGRGRGERELASEGGGWSDGREEGREQRMGEREGDGRVLVQSGCLGGGAVLFRKRA